MQLVLKLLNGEIIQQSIDSESFIVGRSSKADVVVPHEGMSRQHCQIEVIHGEIFVTDLGSTNGVMINGEKIKPHTRTPYQTFWPLSFGAVQSLHIEQLDHGMPIDEPPVVSNNNTRTITKAMQENLRKDPFDEPRKMTFTRPSRDARIKNIVMNVFAILILMAAVYWYVQKEDAPAPVQTHDSPPEESRESFDRF